MNLGGAFCCREFRLPRGLHEVQTTSEMGVTPFDSDPVATIRGVVGALSLVPVISR